MLHTLFHQYRTELLRFLARRLGSAAQAGDLVHDLYLKLTVTADHADIRDRKAYLFRLAANLATDHVRAERRRREILAEIDPVAWSRSEELTPERHAAARAELRVMEQVIAALPERSRQVFHLCRYQGKSRAEIAAELGIGVTTVYTDMKLVMDALTRARQNFRATRNDDER